MILMFYSQKLLIFLCLLITAVGMTGGYLWYDSHRALTFMAGDEKWQWVEYHPFHYGVQQARTTDSRQLFFRQVDMKQRFSAFVSTTNNNHLLFTFIKEMACDEQKMYTAKLSLDNEATIPVKLNCDGHNRVVFRVAPRDFKNLTLTSKYFYFHLDHDVWQIASLRKDDFMQHNYKFFEKHGDEPIYQWSRD